MDILVTEESKDKKDKKDKFAELSRIKVSCIIVLLYYCINVLMY